MAELWCPGAEKIPGPHAGGSGPMTGGPPRAIWHRTAGGTYESNKAFLIREGFEPHLLWDPNTGDLGQFMPANVGGFAVQHTAVQQTNRMGRYCIQIEVADHGETWDITSTPMKGLTHIIGWLRQLGIPDVLPAGPMAKLGSNGRRDPKIWGTKGGHYGHCHVPQNDHTDPGRMDFTKIFGGTPVSTSKGFTVAHRAVIKTATGVLTRRGAGHSPLNDDARKLTVELMVAAKSAEAVK